MARHDVFQNHAGGGYFLDVQTDYLSHLNTRIVVPLLPLADAPKPAKRLNPIFEIKGERHMMATQYLAAVPGTILKKPVVNVSDRFDEITNALDMIFNGF